MPLAVTHVILTIIAVDLFRDYIIKKHRKYFTLHTIMIAGIAGLLPDIDVAISWLFELAGKTAGFLGHGGITHTAAFGAIFLVPAYYFHKKKSHKTATYFFVICFGILFHLLLDYILGGGMAEGVMWLWPLSTQVYKIHLVEMIGLSRIPAAIDAAILIAWLWHEEAKHKIRDFI